MLKSGRSTFPGVHAHANLGAFFDRVPELEAAVSEWLEHEAQRAQLPGADGAELVAVVHEPDGPPSSVTVLLAGGVLPRMGVNRVLVRMADRLAAAGHRVVRVDPARARRVRRAAPRRAVLRSPAARRVGRVRRRRPPHSRGSRAGRDAAVPLVLFGTCGGGITALRVAEQLERVTGVIAVGVPLKRSGARIPPGFARRTERRRALRQLAELRHRTGSGRVRRVIRPLVWSLVPRFSRRLPDDADRWLNTPLLGSMRALYSRRLPRLAPVRRERHRARRDRGAVPRPHRLGERPWFELGLIPAVGHQLDDPDEVDAVAERIQAFAEQLRVPAGRSAATASAVLRPAGDPAAS